MRTLTGGLPTDRSSPVGDPSGDSRRALYCVYEAPGPDPIHRHAECGGFPADAVHEVARMIDPSTAG